MSHDHQVHHQVYITFIIVLVLLIIAIKCKFHILPIKFANIDTAERTAIPNLKDRPGTTFSSRGRVCLSRSPEVPASACRCTAREYPLSVPRPS